MLSAEVFEPAWAIYDQLLLVQAPNGMITQLMGPALPMINGQYNVVAIDSEVRKPEVAGSRLNAVNVGLAFSYALEGHFLVRKDQTEFRKGSKRGAYKEAEWASWTEPFGNYVRQEGYGKNPGSSNLIGGLLAGIDGSYGLFSVGAGAGYGYNTAQYDAYLGQGTLNEQMFFTYGCYHGDRIRLNNVIWAGMYQSFTRRSTLTYIVSTARPKGVVVSPHLELAVPLKIVEPFCMVDWINDWQDQTTEADGQGFHLVVPQHHISVLRSEMGTRFYQVYEGKWGAFKMQEKLSYVYQVPFNLQPLDVTYEGSTTPFLVAIGSEQPQNLAALELHASFAFPSESYPSLILDLQGEWGEFYQSYSVGFGLGKVF